MPDESDARWLAEKVILPEMGKLRESMEKRDEQIWEEITSQRKCITNIKLESEREKGRRSIIEKDVHRTIHAIAAHVKDEDSHYNPYYTETMRHKLWRKKPEIAAGSGFAVLVVTAIEIVRAYWGV